MQTIGRGGGLKNNNINILTYYKKHKNVDRIMPKAIYKAQA